MKNRKTERKNRRKEKKAKRNEFYLKKSKKSEEIEKNERPLQKTTSSGDQPFVAKKKKQKQNIEIKAKPKQLSAKQKRDLERDDIEIKRLEKLLKLNRRKKKGKQKTSLPMSFKTEGLDYILDVIGSYERDGEEQSDSNRAQNVIESDSDLNDESDSYQSASDMEDEEVVDEVSDDGDNQLGSEIGSEDGVQQEVDDEDESELESDESDNESDKPKANKALKEDIYGFLRDGSGNIVKPESDSKKIVVNRWNETGLNEQLMRRIRGSLNRLTVNNIVSISGQIQELFEQNSRFAVNEVLFKCINASLIDLDYVTASKLKTESALLIAILHNSIGEEVGGHMIHSCVCKFDGLLKLFDTNDSKIIDNLVIFLLNLYVCGVVESQLIYELMDKLCDNFTEKSIELINLILSSVGFVLRKDSAIKMKDLILKVQNEAKKVDKSNLSGSRVGFLLDSLMAIKNNNMTKLKGYGSQIDIQLIETTLKNAIKRSRVNGIPGTYEAILQSSHWYSYTQNIEAIALTGNKDTEIVSEKASEYEMNDKLIKTLRLNTPLRKAIVVALNSCEDYIDASNKLIAIGQKQFSEVVNVLLHVSIHEKQFNPFYSHLLSHLGKCDRKYRLALDFGIRDKISDLATLKPKERHVLAQLMFDLMKLNALAITCLKVVQFSDMNETCVQFLKDILTPVFEDEALIQQILSKIPNKDSFATAIRLFINCFIDPKHRNKLNLKTNQ